MRRVVSGFLLLALLFTVGCSSTVGPDKVVMELLNTSIKSDWETVYKLTGGVDPGWAPDQAELMRSILARDTYKVGSEKVDGEKAEVIVTITALDLPRITGKMASETLSMKLSMPSLDTDAYSRQYFTHAIGDPNAPMVTSDVTITLVRKDGSWIVKQEDHTLTNALTGGMESAFGIGG